ncbi:MAG: 2-C-methyl-D-erythritol 4-phosphate cytidylyltransferase [FCB group bacterium]|nr:2-C-methyl-D-erythritol 4-phosphate cytidylyltransferase [FCB group bacterium]MBL7027237.1 2-C-methyl-D-erythritol 4-phosphate cytidylyltransferase [Candidatus Neomarinimicrobiota bacterium]MBL7120528.1 2-C-methyl-D-erythritol 4-phosphate cytidylyltransferase [Candidatus Neomarinimicrobiota bacterium]
MNVAIILAGGKGERFGGEVPKQFVVLHGHRVMDYAIKAFEQHPEIDKIIIVVPANWKAELALEYPQHLVVLGGDTRRESSYNGLIACPEDTDKVLLHDAARPFLDYDTIQRVLDALKNYDAVDTAIAATDTIIEVKDNIITDMPVRDFLYQGQTPQGFNYKVIRKAHESIFVETTDDIRLAIEMGIQCVSVAGSQFNFKITSSNDLYMAERVTQINAVKTAETPQLDGKKVLIFGGTGGIGSALSEILKSQNADVTALGSEVDLTKDTLPESLTRDWDIIIHTAGIFIKKPFSELSVAEWDKVMAVNLRSAFLVAQLARKTMKQGGWLTFIGSSSSHRGRTSQSVYAASKAALNNLTQSLAAEFLDDNIRVNCINPPRTDTPMRHQAFPGENRDLLADPGQVAKDILKYCSGEETGHIVNLKYTTQFRAKR